MAQSSEDRVFVFDATAFYAGIALSGGRERYTTPEVLAEVSHGRIGMAVEGVLEAGMLKAEGASQRGIRVVRETADGTGDLWKLSEADISVLALASDLKDRGTRVMIVSDDYSVANVAKVLGLEHSLPGAKNSFKEIRWRWYCPGCGKTFTGRVGEVCDVCGSKLKRKATGRETPNRSRHYQKA